MFQKGTVTATNKSRVGLIHKTGNSQIYQPYKVKERDDSEPKQKIESNRESRFECATPLVLRHESSGESSRSKSAKGNNRKLRIISRSRVNSKDEPKL